MNKTRKNRRAAARAIGQSEQQTEVSEYAFRKDSATSLMPFKLRVKSSGNEFWAAIALIAVTAFVYAPVSHYGFVLYDDLQYVAENANIQGAPIWQSIRWALTTSLAGYWAPLTWLSHILDAQIFGPSAGPQHVVNVVFHTINSLLIFGLFCRMTDEWKPSLFVAALFAVHPLHVESVAWIAERKDVLSTCFLLLTVWTYVTYTSRPSPRRYFLVVLFFALGLMAKPMLVTVPFLLILLDIWPLRRLRVDHRQWQQLLSLAYEKLPFLVLASITSVVTIAMSSSRGGIESIDGAPLGLRVTNAAVSYVAYIRDMVWPAGLAAFYPFEQLPPWEITGCVLALLAVSAFVVWHERQYPYLLVGWLWYIVMLAPVVGLVQAGGQSRADRFTYMPLVGLFAGVAWGIPQFTNRWKYRRIVLSAATGIVLCGCVIASRRQVQYWSDAVTLWEHALDVTTGNYIAHTVVGFALARDGRIDESILHYRKALSIQPNFAEAHNNLGIALSQEGHIAEAIPEFQEAVRLAPDVAMTHYDLGFALAEQGGVSEAIPQYLEAVRLDPNYVAAFTKLGDALSIQGRLNEAITAYSEALRIQPNFADALDNLGFTLASQGKYEEAIARYNEALRVRPDFAEAHNNLGSAFANLGRYDDAIAQFTEALRLQPRNEFARDNLALMWKLQGKTK